MHLLDTDTLTHLHAGHPRVVANLRALDDPEVGTTIVTKIEILRARYDFVLKASDGNQLLRAQHWLSQSEQLLAGLLIVPFDAASASQFDKLVQTRKLKKIGRADLLIASIASANRATLVTRNTRHFQQVPNLNVVNWVDS
ncbi:MAG: type II toxin-antitoxin system VapC family toxin [Planctomycetota bacterium]